jgi:hypothetical protein
MMEMGRQEKRSPRLEFFEFGLIPAPHPNGSAIAARQEKQQVAGGMRVKAETEKRNAQSAAGEVFPQDGLFPPAYI